MAYSVILEGGSPWGFRLQGGKEFNEPIKIAKLNPNSKAYNQGIKVGDYLNKINGTSTATLKHNDALQLIRSANNKLELELRRSDSVKKKTVIPEIRINGPTVNGTTPQTNGNLSDSDYYYSSCDEEGIVRTNAITNYHSSSGSAGSAGHLSDGDGSSSGSQSSVVHVVGPYKGPLADKMKNISNSSSSGPEPAPKEAGKAIPQTTVWSPFGVNKVRTYKPVSFSIIGHNTSPAASSSQGTAASSTFVNTSVNANVNTDVNTGAASTTTAAPTSARPECREVGQSTPSTSQTLSAPTYSNFNGNSSVIVNSSTPASAYTSITMNSRKEEREPKDDLSLRTSSITKPLSGAGSPTTPVTTASEPWMPSKVSALIDAELKEREREREQLKEGQHKPATWGVSSSTEPNLTQYTALNLASSETASKSEPSLTKLGESFLWKEDQTTTLSSATVTTTTTTTMATHPTQSTTTSYSSHNGSLSHHAESKLGLPTYQSPTITLLQKSRELKNGNFEIPPDIPAVRVDESEVPKDAILVGTKETIEGDKKHMDTYYLLPGDKEHSKSRRIVQRKTTKYEGIGPTDEATGVPIIPRGSVDEKAHKDWYRRMYKSLHKVEKHEDVNTYKPTYVFPELETDSEVEEGTGSTMSMDRAGYGKKSFTLPHARYRETKYKVQPMSIENYEPGFSSIAFQERKVDREPARTPDHPQQQQDKKPYTPPATAKDEKQSEKKSYLYNPPIEKPGQFSKYIYSDSEPELKKKEQPLSPQSDAESREAYRRIQKGGDIPYEGLHFPVPPKKDDEVGDIRPQNGSATVQSARRHVRSKSVSSLNRAKLPTQSAVERLGIKSPPPAGLASTLKEHVHTTTATDSPRQRHSVSGTGRSPTGSWDSRRRRDEEAARRKQEMKRITAQEKLKRMEEERKANEARRHNDFLTPSQKSPIPLNRYEDVPDISDLQRPKKKVGVQYRGKARALYNFKAQNPKELSFKKNDIIYLLRQIDKNWYEGEHHGLVGLFPVNYVEVLMSLDEARQAAIMREGRARAKYNFTAQSNMEVSFKKGDTVSLIRRIDNNWFEGRVDGKHGIFPVSYVEVLQEPDTPLPTPMSSYAPTPATGSPGQLSPVSTISNGPAPTIPSAPISPRSSVDNFDFGQPFSFSQYQPSTTASLQRGTRRDHSYADYGLDPLNQMRPASALGGITDGYGTMPRDRYNPANRPNSAVPFSDYMKTSTRDSGFYSSEESKYSRQKSREEELMRSLSNPYEGRQSSMSRDSFSRAEEPRYPPYQAMYSYRPQNPDELELREGDIVYVMEKCDDDWYVGTSQRTKEFGTFPGNYVRPL